MFMFEYSRKVYYYETDKMGVVHHSNYPRWLEEARGAFFDGTAVPYAETEALGVMVPVISINLKFKHFGRYGDTFTVRLSVANYTGVRFDVVYTVVNQDGEVLLTGESRHAFIDETYRPISLARKLPERHKKMLELFPD